MSKFATQLSRGLLPLVFCGLFSAGLARADDKAPNTGSAAVDASRKGAAASDVKKSPSKFGAAASKGAAGGAGPVVEIKTSEGTIKLQLDEKVAPLSVKNFLGYVSDKFYDGTIFHRVIKGFMIQGGGFAIDSAGKMTEKATKPPIANEAKNGLKNDRGTIAMARTGDPNSATSQFFINLVDNDRLNFPQPDGHGYAVFGKVIEGMDVVDRIANVKTGVKDGMGDVPDSPIKILSVTLVKGAG